MAFMTLNHPDSVLSVLTISSPDCVITGCQDHVVRIWDGAAWTCVQELHGHTRAVLSLATLDQILATGGSDSQILLWDMRHGLVRSEAREEEGVLSPKLNIVGGFSSIARIKLGAGAIYSMKMSKSKPQGSESCLSIFAGCQDTSVYRVDVRLTSPTGPCVVGLVRFAGACGFTYSVSLDASDPPSLFAGAGDGIIRVWEACVPATIPACTERLDMEGKRLSAHRDVVKMPGIVSTEATWKVFDCKGLEPTQILPARQLVVAVHEDAMHAECAPHAHEAEQSGWTEGVGQQLMSASSASDTLPGRCGSVYALAMHGSDLYSGTQDGDIRVFDAHSGHMKYVLTGHTKEVLSLCILEDASRPKGYYSHLLTAPTSVEQMQAVGTEPALLCSGGADHCIRIWSVRTYMCLHVITQPCGVVLCLSSLGHMLYCAESDSSVSVFDTSSLHAPRSTANIAIENGDLKVQPFGMSTTHAASAPSVAASPGAPGGFESDDLKAVLQALLSNNPALLPKAKQLENLSSRTAPSSISSAKSFLNVGDADIPVSTRDGTTGVWRLDAQAAGRADLSQQAMLSCLRELVAIPSVSLDSPSHPRDVNSCWKAAQFVHDLLLRLGAECRMVQGAPGCNPIVLGRVGGWDAAVPTLCLQATYDVQPPGDMAAWASPPFTLTGRDGYLYARGATDNKGPLMAMIFAVARFARGTATFCAPKCNFVFVIEGEGENGSVGFREAILQNLEWFSNTTVIINCNNTWIGETVPCLTYGMRGLVKIRLEVAGPSTDLHSGLDGGTTHEPLQDLCSLLGALVEPTSGRIAVTGMYDQVASFSTQELSLYRDVDFEVSSYMEARGLAGVYSTCTGPVSNGTSEEVPHARPAKRLRLEMDEDSKAEACNSVALHHKEHNFVASLVPPSSTQGASVDGPVQEVITSAVRAYAVAAAEHLDVAAALLLRRWREPALTVHGITCSIANDSIIPRKAIGFISVRTVPYMGSTVTFESVSKFLREKFAARRSPNKLTVAMTSHAAWWLQSPTAPHFQAAARAINAHWGRPPIFVREGGTVRVTTFLEKTLKAPAIHIPVGQSSDAPHLPNERIRLLNLVTGMKVLETFFHELAASSESLSKGGADDGISA